MNKFFAQDLSQLGELLGGHFTQPQVLPVFYG